jgi:hypothetical protein
MRSKGQLNFGVGQFVSIMLVLASLAAGLSFSGVSNPLIVNSGSSNQFFNLSVNNTGPGSLIMLNVTFPAGLTYVSSSAGTSASNAVLTESSNSIRWDNQTPDGFVDTTGLQFFWFNSSISQSSHGDPYFNVTAANTTYDFNSTAVPFRVLVDVSAQGDGNFTGTLDAGASTYQSFYFNASDGQSSPFVNATGINVTVVSASDVDVFLLDNASVLRAKGVSKIAGTESLAYNYVTPADGVWEIRVYGSSASPISFSGTIALSGLGAADGLGAPLAGLNFGSANYTGGLENVSRNFTLFNEGAIQLGDVGESTELYLYREFFGASSANFSALVPDSSITTRLRVGLNWTGGSGYSLRVYDSLGSLLGESSGVYDFANVSGVNQEEYVDITSLPSTTGIFRLEAVEVGGVGSPYEITVKSYVSPSIWMRSNFTSYSQTVNFNSSGQNNSTYPLELKMTVPSNAVNGTYIGSARYAGSAKGSGVSIPIRFEVSTPVLVVNGVTSSINSTIDVSYGTSSSPIVNLNVSNYGSLPLSLTFSNSSGLAGNGTTGSSVPFSYDPSGASVIQPGSSALVPVTLTFSSSLPITAYNGWILINGTSANATLSPRPYQNVLVNLTIAKPWITLTTNFTTPLAMTNLSSTRYYAFITNNGPMAANVTAAPYISSSCAGFVISAPTFVNCPSAGFAPGANSTGCIAYWNITSYDASSAVCTSTINGGIAGYYTGSPTFAISVSKASNGATTTTVSGQSGGLGGPVTTTVRQPAPQYTFTKADSIVSVKQDASNTSVVTVRNSGDKAANVTFSVLDMDASWYRVNSTSASLPIGHSASFMVTFVIGDVDVRDYTARFGVTGGGVTGTSAFTLRVLPAPQKIVEINSTLPLLLANFTRVYSEINDTKSQGGVDVSGAELAILDAQAKIELAKGYIASGDYFSAYQQYAGIQSSIASAETNLTASKESASSPISGMIGGADWIFILIVGAIFVGLAAGGYFIWTRVKSTQEGGRFQGYSPQKKASDVVQDAGNRLKDRFTLDVHPKHGYEASVLLEQKPMPRFDGRVIAPVGRFTIESRKGVADKVADGIKGIKRRITGE